VGRVIDTVKRFDKVNDPSKVSPTSTFDELGLGALDVVELIIAVEEDFCMVFPDEIAENLTSIKDTCSHLFPNPNLV